MEKENLLLIVAGIVACIGGLLCCFIVMAVGASLI